MSRQPIVIIGAGPAGLSAAHESIKHGLTPLVFERDHIVGGLARTESHRGFHFDIGGHRFYTKIEEIERLWEEMLGPDFLLVSRLSRIHYNDKFFRYPLDGVNALRNLGLTESARVMSSYVRSQWRPITPEDTFESWVSNRFGQRLYETFFKHYTEKVWGIPCETISADWAAQRIKGLSLSAAVKNALLGTNGVKSLIEEFRYPRLGPGMMWRRFQEVVEAAGGRVQLGTEALRFHHRGNRITAVTVRCGEDTSVVSGDSFISSMPITHLVERIDDVPAPVLAAARQLHYRAFILVGLIVDHPKLFPDNWIYVHSPAVRAGRIQNYKNWSIGMAANPDKTNVGVEYFCTEADGLWEMSDAALSDLAVSELERLRLNRGASVDDCIVYRHPMAYPVYDQGYAQHLRVIRGFLNSIHNLQTVGRNGMHRYNNQDHSMLTGMLAVRNLFGQSHDLWEVNTERSYVEEDVITQARKRPAPAVMGLEPRVGTREP